MAELKTKPSDASVEEFLNKVEPAEKRRDAFKILDLMQEITGEKPVMWGTSIVGFGKYHYKSERSSQEGDWPLIGFSPRKQNLTIYILSGFGNSQDLLQQLGKYKTSVSCLYIKRLSDVDQDVLAELVKKAFADMKQNTL
jgi:hypothetical protein